MAKERDARKKEEIKRERLEINQKPFVTKKNLDIH